MFVPSVDTVLAVAGPVPQSRAGRPGVQASQCSPPDVLPDFQTTADRAGLQVVDLSVGEVRPHKFPPGRCLAVSIHLAASFSNGCRACPVPPSSSWEPSGPWACRFGSSPTGPASPGVSCDLSRDVGWSRRSQRSGGHRPASPTTRPCASAGPATDRSSPRIAGGTAADHLLPPGSPGVPAVCSVVRGSGGHTSPHSSGFGVCASGTGPSEPGDAFSPRFSAFAGPLSWPSSRVSP